MNNTEILNKYTDGTNTLEKTNELLAANGAGYTLDPDRNKITDEEAAAAVASVENAADFSEISGYGLMDTGTGSKDKVSVLNGKVTNATGEQMAIVFIGGRVFRTACDVITEEIKMDTTNGEE
jgi:hypothetical protein